MHNEYGGSGNIYHFLINLVLAIVMAGTVVVVREILFSGMPVVERVAVAIAFALLGVVSTVKLALFRKNYVA